MQRISCITFLWYGNLISILSMLSSSVYFSMTLSKLITRKSSSYTGSSNNFLMSMPCAWNLVRYLFSITNASLACFSVQAYCDSANDLTVSWSLGCGLITAVEPIIDGFTQKISLYASILSASLIVFGKSVCILVMIF